jgi:kumamolisin
MFRYLIVILSILLAAPLGATAASHPASKGLTDMVRLPGHVLPALAQAKRVDMGASADKSKEPMTLTLVLKRDDQAGFDRYLHDVYDPKSKIYRKFLSQKKIASKFGPSRKAYDEVLGYLRKHGFELVEGSANRMTLTVRGTRIETDQAFNIYIGNYAIDHKNFYANDSDPALPENLAKRVETVMGLTNLAKPQPTAEAVARDIITVICSLRVAGAIAFWNYQYYSENYYKIVNKCRSAAITPDAQGRLGNLDPPPPAWQGVDGTGQTIGLLEFDSFYVDDIKDYIELIGLPANVINNLSQVHVNGGFSPTPGANQSEVLLDIDNVIAIAPGSKIVVYDAPLDGTAASYSALFNAMINDGVDIISNSWASCEDQVTLADVQGIDSVLQSAAAAGISVFNGAGDSGSTCLDGSQNTITVPADSPHATAVGGTSLTVDIGYTYGSEVWWDGSKDIPPSGQGGFGISKFFGRPTYQDGLNPSAMRSIPDVSVNADPAKGVQICAKNLGGCPTGLSYGGTSSSAPIWAAMTALLNQAQGNRLGTLNPLFYPLANTDAFHNATSMGSDFTHVGLGSPNLPRLHQRLTSQLAGAVSSSVSQALGVLPGNLVFPTNLNVPVIVPADGVTEAFVVVRLADANGNVVSGKTVKISTNSTNAIIEPADGVSDFNTGVVVFNVKNLTAEALTFTASDVTDNIVLDQKPSMTFLTPPATSAGINAFPTTVSADGTSTTSITATLKDSLNRPTPGKQITLSQGTGHSIITGPNPSITDANGQITFTATNLVNETVTYSAIDVTDGNLPIPGNPQVTFSGGSGSACGQNTPLPVGQNGYTVTPFVTGIVAGPLSFGSITFGNCTGISTPAFLNDSVFIANILNGDLFKLGATGGAVSSANRLSTQGPTLISPVFGKDGKLYAARAATTGNGFTGAILELDPVTGVLIRNVVSNVSCPFSLAIDPLSGDLFFDNGCSGSFSDPTVHRVRNPGSATPTLEVYATLPTSQNGQISFAPNGTMYVDTGYFGTGTAPTISVVSGTNAPSPATVTTLPGVNSFFWVSVAESDANGAAKSLLITTSLGLELLDLTTQTHTLLAQNIGGGTIGPDGCLYPITDTVYKLTDPTGGCNFLASGASPSLSLALAANSPSAVQGNPETFNATLQKVSAPEGTAVFFTVTGANPQIKLVRADANGKAALTYTAVFAGKDTITATATVNGATLQSNPVDVTWAAGEHVTFLSLNPSPTGGTQNQPLNVSASLTDVSATPAAPVANQVVNFTLDGGSCTATTDANGIASCSLTPFVLGGGTLTASFAGTNLLIPATATIGFNTMAVAVEPLPTVTIAVNPNTVAPGASAALTWSSTGATSCTASGAWTGPQATSGSQNVSQAQPGTYTYTLTCDGPGGSASKSTTLTVNELPTVSITVAPSTVASGVNSTLSWSSTNATACTASGAWSGSQATSGNLSVTQAQPGTYTYTLTCDGTGGTASNSATLTVAPLPTVTISVNPSTVAPSANSTLTWSSTNATNCTASGAWSGSQQTSGNLTVSQAQPGTYTYALSCDGPGGATSGSTVLSVQSVSSLIPFKSFLASLEIERKEFELSAKFALGLNNDGINPVTEKVSLRIGNYSATIPAGKFKKGVGGKFSFEGKVNGATLEIVIAPTATPSLYQLKVEGKPAQVVGSAKQVPVELTIGNDSGKATAKNGK